MFAHDQEYLSGMATAVLAVLMLIVMFWIRSKMPDDAAGTPAGTQQSAEHLARQDTVHTAMNDGDDNAARRR